MTHQPFLPDSHTDETFMRAALREAEAAYQAGDVPVGAVVVYHDQIIGRGCNQREALNDPTAHAEMIAITAAAAKLRNWRLEGCTLFVTLEPCAMCAGAIVLARIPRLVFGAADPKAGACVSLFELTTDRRLNHRVELGQPVLTEPCAKLLRNFFTQQRAMGKK